MPALLVVLLVAALCPLLPASPAAAAGGSIIELPENFSGYAISDNGDVAGSYWNGTTSDLALWSDGALTVIPVDSLSTPLVSHIGDDGVATGLANGSIYIFDKNGLIRTIPKPTVDGTERWFQGAWRASGDRVIGKHAFASASERTGLIYQGASPPTAITAIATVMAANYTGQVFGQIPGDTVGWAMQNGGTVTPVNGLVNPPDGGLYVQYMSDDGRILYRTSPDFVTRVWEQGVSRTVDVASPVAVNSSGVVLGHATVNGLADTGLWFPDGTMTPLRSLLGGAPQYKYLSPFGMNDTCDVVGSFSNDDGRYGGFVAKTGGCNKVDIEGGFFRLDGGSPFVRIGDDADVRLRVENASSKELTNVRVVSTEVVEDESGGKAVISAAGGLSPTTLDAQGPGSLGFADFKLKGEEVGTVTLKAEIAATKEGKAVSGTIEREFQVRQDDLVVNLKLDPPEYEEAEDGTFEPVDITATVSFTNATNDDMTSLKLQDLDVSRVFSGQELYVTYKSGINPDPIDPEVIVPELKAGATSPEFTAVFTATENGEVEFSAFATAASNGKAVAGVAKERWKAKVKKFVEVKTTVTNPADDGLLNAGGQIIIDGTVENLTNNYDITLGPLFPELAGNTGTMSLGYDGNAPNPTAPVPVEPMELGHGQTRTFQVRITTNYSDPRMFEAQPSGGTRAYARFEPWGEAIEVQDGNAEEAPERVDIRTYDEADPGDASRPGEDPDAQVKADPTDLFKRVSIDDSIEFESDKSYAAVAAGIMVGAVEGLANAAIATVYSIPDLFKMPYTILVAAYDFQAKVWESFTEEEKDLFLTETSFMIVSVLQRNVEFGLKAPGELYDQVYAMAGEHLIQTQNDWQIGDYTKTTQGYSAFMSETIGSVAGPVILSKMAQSPKAVAALERFQGAINARMAATWASAKNLKYVDNVLPVLQSIENGAEPTLTAIAKLWGVTPEEIAEYKRICGVIGCIATIRSRHASSAEWIKKLGAMLKPEILKIKTVSELDVLLGYNLKDLGSLIFKKPEVLKNLAAGASKDEVAAEIANFVKSKGFKPGTSEHLEATKRVEMRVKEWNKHEKAYKQWNDRGWIDTTFNYEDNAIPDFKFDANGNIIGKLTGGEKGNFKGFRMVEQPKGSDEFVVQMLDGKSGKWRRITGDIDPVDFTYTDGSPLSPEDLAKLTKMLQDSPLGAEHGYTATFKGFKDPKTGQVLVDPGPELVKSQFKPNEPALQIAPDSAPRAARIDVENSRWVSPEDYNMRWVGGFVDAGTKRGRGLPQSVGADFDVIPLDAPAQIALPVKAKPADPTVGRFILKHGNKGDTAALMMGASGRLQTVLPDGTTQDSPLHDQAFSERPTETITVSPVSALEDEPEPDQAPFNLFGFGGGTTPSQAAAGATAASSVSRVAQETIRLSAASLDAGSDTIRVSNSPGLAAGATGFEVGQELAIGTGSDNMELRKVASVDDGVLTLTEPLEFTHEPGEVVVMVVSAAGVPVNPDKGVDPAPDPDPDTGGTGTDPGTKPGTDSTGGSNTDGAGTTGTPVGTQGSGASDGNGTSPGTGSGSASGTSNSSGSVSSTGGSSSGGPLAYTGSNPLALVLFALFAIVLGTLANRRRWHRLGTTGGGKRI